MVRTTLIKNIHQDLIITWLSRLRQEGKFTITVLYTRKRVCDVALIKRTLSSGKPKKGWEFGGEGTRE
jgi:hypothetical protein